MLAGWILAGSILLGFAFRLFKLTAGTIWLDEGYTTVVAEASWIDILKLTPYDANPPLPALFYKAWGIVFGQTEFALEMASVIAGTLSILALYKFALRIYNSNTALIAALLLAISTYHIHVSQQIRSYALAILLAILLADRLWQFIRSDKKIDWLLIVYTIAFLNCHYYAPLVAGSLFGYAYLSERKNEQKAKSLLSVSLILLALYTPTLYALYLQYTTHHNFAWIPPPTIRDVLGIIVYIGSASPIGAVILLSSVVIGLVRGYRTRFSSEEKKATGLLLTWLILPLVFAYLLSLAGKPFFHVRYGVFVLPPFLIIAARGMAMPKIRTQVFLYLLVLGSSLLPIEFYYQNTARTAGDKEDFARISKEFQEGDAILHTTKCSFIPARFYHQRAFPEFLLDSAAGSRIIEHWLAQTARISVPELSKFKRVWIYHRPCAPPTELYDVLESEDFKNLGATKDFQSNDAKLYRFNLAN